MSKRKQSDEDRIKARNDLFSNIALVMSCFSLGGSIVALVIRILK